MKITVTIDTENDAFHQEFNEVYNVFRAVADHAMRGRYDEPIEHAVIDTYGNACGLVVAEESE